jgi:hypothetical protein
VTERRSDNGVPLRAVVGLALFASVLARGVSPALPGVTVGLETTIWWTARLASLVTLLAATGLVAGIVRLAAAVIATPRTPWVARIVVVPLVALGCLLLLFASFRPLEPLMALVLGVSASVIGLLSARFSLANRERRAAALVLGLTAAAGLIHVVARKLALDASDAASITAFRASQVAETLAAVIDAAALVLALIWLHRRSPRGRILVPAVLALSALAGVLAVRGSSPTASTFAVLVSRALDPFSRGPTALFPPAFSHSFDAAALLAAAAALMARGGELGTVLAACLAARGALDIPIPALLLELAALYLPFAKPPVRAQEQQSATEPEQQSSERSPAASPDTSTR